MESPADDRTLTRCMDAIAAGTTNQNSIAVALRGFVDHTFIGLTGTITATAVTGLQVEESPDGSAGWTEVAGAAVAFADSDDDEAKEVRVGVEDLLAASSHIRCVFERGTANAVIDGMVCKQRRMTA